MAQSSSQITYIVYLLPLLIGYTGGRVVAIYPEGIDWHVENDNLLVGLAGIGDNHMLILSNIAIVFGDIEEVDKVLAHQDAAEIYRLLTQEVQE